MWSMRTTGENGNKYHWVIPDNFIQWLIILWRGYRPHQTLCKLVYSKPKVNNEQTGGE